MWMLVWSYAAELLRGRLRRADEHAAALARLAL